MEKNKDISTRSFIGGKTRSIDTLRGIAVIFMLSYHFMVWLLRVSDRGLVFESVNVLATFFAPAMFFILTGVTLAFSVTGRRERGQKTQEIALHVLKRYGGLILIGMVLNVILWGVKSFWLWDVLEVIGLCNLIAFLLILSGSEWVIIAGGLIGLGSFYPILAMRFPPIVDAVLANPLTGIFPVGPFLFFTVLGVIIGRRMMGMIKKGEGLAVCRQCLVAGAAFLVGAVGLSLARIQIDRYPPSVSYVMLASGVTILLLSAVFWWQDVKGHKATLVRPLMIYGRNALNIYIGHYLAYKIFVLADMDRRFHLWSSVVIIIVLLIAILGLTIYTRPKSWQDTARQ